MKKPSFERRVALLERAMRSVLANMNVGFSFQQEKELSGLHTQMAYLRQQLETAEVGLRNDLNDFENRIRSMIKGKKRVTRRKVARKK